METVTLHLDEETAARLRRLAEARKVTMEDLVKEWAIETEAAPSPAKIPFWGMMKDEPELVDEIVEEAMQARERRWSRNDGG